jgi:hypothetical protein
MDSRLMRRHLNRIFQRYVRKEERQQAIEMNEWGGEHSFIEETRSCWPRFPEHLKNDDERLLYLLECELPPANDFKIFINSMDVWAN